MITKIESASNSTQLTQIALDGMLREFAETSRLPIARLQKSISNKNSPIRGMYTTLLAYMKAEQLCQEHFKQLRAHKETLKERKKKVQSLLLQNNNPSQEESFREELTINARLEKNIEELEYKLTRIHNKCKALNKIRMQRLKNYIDQYDISRQVLIKTLKDEGYTQFTEEDINDAFATTCYIHNNNQGSINE